MKLRTKVIICVTLLLIFAFFAVAAVNLIKKQLYPLKYTEFVEKYAEEYTVPKDLLFSIIRSESNFDPEARSHVGATGLMQLMPSTLEWLSKMLGEESPTGEITDPETNIKYGTFYLSYLYQKFGSWETAIAAYNAGHGRVDEWLKDENYSDDGKTLKNIPFAETRNYVNRVFAAKEEYYSLYFKNGEE